MSWNAWPPMDKRRESADKSREAVLERAIAQDTDPLKLLEMEDALRGVAASGSADREAALH